MESEHFRDFDEFAESVRDVDAQMLFRNPTHRTWEINHLNLPRVHVQLGRLGSGNIVEGISRPDGYLLYLPLTDECEYSANGVTVPKHGFMVLEPGCDFCISTRYEHDWCTIVVPSDVLPHRNAREEKSSEPDKMICRVTRPDRQVAEQFLALVRGPLTVAARHPEFEGSLASTRVAADLLRVGSLVLGKRDTAERSPPGRPKASRQEIIRRSMELLEEREGEHIAVPNLAAAANVSERTLRTAFDEYYGVGPVGYLQLRKLHQVRRALQAAEPDEVTVSSVLLEHGIWDFGRFAARYRHQFDELPSETLRAKRR